MKHITFLLFLSYFISANASEQKSIKRIEVQSKKITVNQDKMNSELQSNKIDTVPMNQTIVTIGADGKSHTQCDIKHNHNVHGEPK